MIESTLPNPAETGAIAKREELVERFARWLESFPVDEALGEDAPSCETPDLHTLLAEMVALRQEVRLQNREQNKAMRELALARESQASMQQAWQHRDAALLQLTAEVEERTARTCAKAFFGVRDALERGMAHARREAAKPRYFWQRWFHRETLPKQNDKIRGYELALQRFDRALQDQNLDVIACEGQPFDPTCMVAVGVSCKPDVPDETVVEQVLCGFRHGTTLLRAAEVIVNRHGLKQEEVEHV